MSICLCIHMYINVIFESSITISCSVCMYRSYVHWLPLQETESVHSSPPKDDHDEVEDLHGMSCISWYRYLGSIQVSISVVERNAQPAIWLLGQDRDPPAGNATEEAGQQEDAAPTVARGGLTSMQRCMNIFSYPVCLIGLMPAGAAVAQAGRCVHAGGGPSGTTRAAMCNCSDSGLVGWQEGPSVAL